MPILTPGAPEFAGFDLEQPFQSELHSEALIEGGAVASFYRNLVASTSVHQQWRNFSRITRHDAGNMAITIGLPVDRLGALSSMFEQAPKISVDAIAKIIDSQELTGALLAFDDALQIVATKVPIVGWFVQLGLFFYETIKGALASAEAAKTKEAQAHAIAYNKQGDQDLVRMLLDASKGSDWTLLFLPQQRAQDVCVSTLAYTPRGVADGYAWEVCKPGADNWGWGLTPGLCSRFTGIVGVYQSPRKLVGSSRDADVGSITGFGELHPSVMQVSMALWQACVKNGVRAFAIEGTKISTAWGDYFELLADRAAHEGGWLGSQMLVSAQWYDLAFRRSRVDGFDVDTLPGRYVGEPYLYSDLIRYVIHEIWKPRLPGFLATLTCAYVSPTAPALKADDKLRERHHEMRSLLLTHRARHEVELDLIPDADYRSAMADAKRVLDPAFQATPPSGAPVDYVPLVATWVGPDVDAAPGVTPVDTSNGGAGVAALLLGLGLAAALPIARHLKRR